MSGTEDAPAQAATLAFLASPEAHGGAKPQRLDTHLSHVFLAGDHVLKLKRAVTLAFVDYGTIEQRKLYCEREITANQKWAPEIYLGVEAVWRAGDQMGLGPPPANAEIVDWVVKMKRFSAANRADCLLAAGALNPDLLEDFADDLATRHASEAPCERMGGSQALLALIQQVSTDLMAAVSGTGLEARSAAWAETIRDAAASHAELADGRQNAGRVKPCHGDLHLKNIVLWKGRLTGFDALEFDPELTHIDTLYDAAFLAMDLMRHGRADLANIFLNRHLAWSDDYVGLALLPVYLALRAGIRALASALAGNLEEADAYLEAAATSLVPPSPARLIAMGGRSGTGKSTLARALAPLLGSPPGAIVLRSDLLRKRMANVAPDQPLPEMHYASSARSGVYGALCDRASLVSRAGLPCILDATFLTEEGWRALDALETSTRTSVCRIWLTAPKAVLRHRLENRGTDASDADLSVLERQLAHPAPKEGWVRVDVSGTQAEALGALRLALGQSDKEAPDPGTRPD